MPSRLAARRWTVDDTRELRPRAGRYDRMWAERLVQYSGGLAGATIILDV